MGKVSVEQFDLSQLEERERESVGKTLTEMLLFVNPSDSKFRVTRNEYGYQISPVTGVVQGYNFNVSHDQRAFGSGISPSGPEVALACQNDLFYFHNFPLKE